MKRATEDDCLQAVHMATMAARAMLDIDIPAVLEELERFDAFAPILDPTMWIEMKHEAAKKQRLLEAALPLWNWAQEQKRLQWPGVQ